LTVPDEQSLHLPGGGLAAGVMGNDSYFDLKKSGASDRSVQVLLRRDDGLDPLV
jgi:hypothetical protein